MLPFGGSFLLTLDSLFSVVLLSYHPTSWVFFFPLSIGKFLTKNPLRSTQRFFLPFFFFFRVQEEPKISAFSWSEDEFF